MTTLAWPSELPRPERNTWQLQPQDARRKRKNDAGPPGYRRRFSSVVKLVTLSVLLTREQKDIFESFFHDDCAEGTSQFEMPDPTTEGWPILDGNGDPLLTGDGQPLLRSGTWLCLWGDQVPVETIQGTEFRKTFSVVVMP
ncbi:hypothetical protein RHVG_00051 [Rhodovulum phage RS1]|uniref:virion structural protein n=1 Tax=Rhodobacter phage RC1 TaxID=754055 RepID=UPI0002C18148|nr:virion structural protein [Rhodobacter phage RC1]YP_007676430.1 virion structural protein [Rhodovulum phage RS1]AGH58016.1 hypothetical protein RHVG_00051 [Rhodovulum phage RS1]AGH58027.1 hypothetical protein RHWG_00006 [Rhodobacter phage RC1]